VNVVLRALEDCQCKVHHNPSGPGYRIRPYRTKEWQVFAPESRQEVASPPRADTSRKETP